MTALSPMLATVGTEIPAGKGWVFEPKYDGIRILAFVAGSGATGKVALISRNGLDKTKQFPEVADALRTLHKRAKRPFVLDGEIVAMNGNSPLRFQELQGRMHTSDAAAIEGHRGASPTALFAFDLLMDGKKSLVAESWRERRERLAALLEPSPSTGALRLSDVGDDGAKMLKEAKKRGWEGVIAKRADAPYAAGRRSPAWVKLKIEHRQEFVVGGWTEPRNSREHLGALLLGYYDANGGLIYAGHTGTGFDRKGLLDMYTRLAKRERKSSPFTTTPKTNAPAHWARPDTVVEIKFNEWTTDGKLRQPVFVGVRDDKPAREVVHEPESMAKSKKPAAKRGRVRAKPAKGAAATLKVRHDAATSDEMDTEIEVSNLDKVYFPKTGHTKGDLLRFYTDVSPYLLPAIADRPLVMKRYPGGVDGPSFYQQRAPADPPPGVRVETVSDEGIVTQQRIIGGDLPTLQYVVQLGAISIDPWHSRVGSIQFADYAIIDLDPGPRAPFARVVEVARVVKDVLDSLDLRAVPKTSGASGMHIVLPLGRNVPNDGARMVAELVATLVVERAPKIATVERAVKARASGAVYVDFLQNIRGKTVASVYSVRAQPIPSVSTPLHWDEVTSALDPHAFTIDTVLARIQSVGDLWAKGMKTPNTLSGVIGRG